jgi:replicative DNA helicase
MILSDPAAERAVLSGIIQYGNDSYLDVVDIIQEATFSVDSNTIIYKCLKRLFEIQEIKTVDIASIYSVAQELNLYHILSKNDETIHLKSIIDFPVNKDNVRKFAAKIRKLEIARLLHKQLELAQDKLLDVSGSESINQILSLAEDTVFDFTSLLNDGEHNPCLVGENATSYIQNLENNPVDQIGIATGFPVYDEAIGGGLRRGTINVIAARPKTGKTLLVDNMGWNIANKNIPVLNLDTEMTREDHINRLLGMISENDLRDIETGKFAQSPAKKEKIYNATKQLENAPIYYKSIAGKAFDEQLGIMRRWVTKVVGLNNDGSAKDCVIFYDYLKLMDTQGMSQDLKEYQLLGFMMTSLHNFAVKYKIPVVAFIQLNRDGINKESTDTASGSDRIVWLCSNFTIFKRKTDEEMAEDGPQNGNRKLVPLISRHGGGLDENDYINCHMKGWCAKITEGKTRIELMKNKGSKSDGFVIEDKEEAQDDNDNISFI